MIIIQNSELQMVMPPGVTICGGKIIPENILRDFHIQLVDRSRSEGRETIKNSEFRIMDGYAARGNHMRKKQSRRVFSGIFYIRFVGLNGPEGELTILNSEFLILHSFSSPHQN